MNTHIKTSDTLYREQMLHITLLTHIRYILNVFTVQNNMNTIYYALNAFFYCGKRYVGSSTIQFNSISLVSLIQRYFVLPALSLEDGILHCDIVQEDFNTADFYRFIKCTLDHMQPFPTPNSMIVMDNCQIHKHPNIQDLIESR